MKKTVKKPAKKSTVHGEPGKYVVHNNDCVPGLRNTDSAKFDLTFADPPFNIGYKGYDKYEDDMAHDDYLKWCEEWLIECYRTLKPHGSFWLAIGDEYVSELDVMAKRLGFYKRSHVLWYYTFGVACSKNFGRSHTHLLYYTKTKSKFTFNYDEPKLRVPSARQILYADKRANPKGKLPDNTWILSPVDLAKMFTDKEDTWLASRVAGTFRERQKRGKTGEENVVPQMPLAVMERIVLASSNPGDVVMDPFVGNGITGQAAVRHNRTFVGYEISPNYSVAAAKLMKSAYASRTKA